MGNSMTERNKRRKKRRIERNMARVDSDGWDKLTEWHWRCSVNGLRFDFWPSTCKARYRGEYFDQVENVEELKRKLSQ